MHEMLISIQSRRILTQVPISMRAVPRYETTRALPIEYGTVHVCSVLAGIIFYREYVYMSETQLALALCGLAIVMCGVACNTLQKLPCEMVAGTRVVPQ